MYRINGKVISTMCQWYVQPIATAFAGHLGKIELNVIGLSCAVSIIKLYIKFMSYEFAQHLGTSKPCGQSDGVLLLNWVTKIYMGTVWE